MLLLLPVVRDCAYNVTLHSQSLPGLHWHMQMCLVLPSVNWKCLLLNLLVYNVLKDTSGLSVLVLGHQSEKMSEVCRDCLLHSKQKVSFSC